MICAMGMWDFERWLEQVDPRRLVPCKGTKRGRKRNMKTLPTTYQSLIFAKIFNNSFFLKFGRVLCVCVCVQIYATPMYEFMDTYFARTMDESDWSVHRMLVRFITRGTYITISTFLGALLPFFGDFITFTGAMACFPLESGIIHHMYLKVLLSTKKPPNGSNYIIPSLFSLSCTETIWVKSTLQGTAFGCHSILCF